MVPDGIVSCKIKALHPWFQLGLDSFRNSSVQNFQIIIIFGVWLHFPCALCIWTCLNNLHQAFGHNLFCNRSTLALSHSLRLVMILLTSDCSTAYSCPHDFCMLLWSKNVWESSSFSNHFLFLLTCSPRYDS